MNSRMGWFNVTSLALGFAFLYLPMLVLVIYSFNASSLVTVWGGFSTKWYVTLYQDQSYWDAAKVTLWLALASSTVATILGTLMAIVIVRHRNFAGRNLFLGLTYSPLIMPEVISGLSLLLLFIASGANRGFVTLAIAHIAFSISYVAIVVSSRLSAFDRSLEEAAHDLGATPAMSFILVTLPNIASSVISAWLLSVTISLDNLVTSSFTTGPGATTLPMHIYSQMRLGVSPEINAFSSIVIMVVLAVTVTISIMEKRRSQRLEDDLRKAHEGA